MMSRSSRLVRRSARFGSIPLGALSRLAMSAAFTCSAGIPGFASVRTPFSSLFKVPAFTPPSFIVRMTIWKFGAIFAFTFTMLSKM